MSFIKIPFSLGWLSNNLALYMHLILLMASLNLLAKPKWGLWWEENNLNLEEDNSVWTQVWLLLEEIK